jgi:type IV secretion system protein TrbB
MLKAWMSGHGGSACTVHAGSLRKALLRIETAIEEGGMEANPKRVAEAIDLVVMMERRKPQEWRLTEMARVRGWNNGEYLLEEVNNP